jgi:hypothetical protein
MALRRDRGAGQWIVAANRGQSSTLDHGATDVCERRIDGTSARFDTAVSDARGPQEFGDLTVSDAGAYRRIGALFSRGRTPSRVRRRSSS